MKHRTKKIGLTTLFAMLMLGSQLPKTDKAEPLPSKRQTRLGKASWYSRKSPGINRHTANREVFDDAALTCAMWNVHFNQKVRVTNKETGKSIIVRVNDRGPHQRLVNKGRIIDLTQRAFSELSPTKHGLISVEIELL